MTGRQSPVYVAVPVDRPPVKLRSKTRVTAQDTNDISTINELRSKLLNVEDSGYEHLLLSADLDGAVFSLFLCRKGLVHDAMRRRLVFKENAQVYRVISKL